MRVGLVCPYGLDVPGGVQNHVRDLAVHLLHAGHEVSVVAPVDDPGTLLPDFVVPVGGTVAVPYNGSVARLAFGPRVAGRVRRWVRDGQFDVLHVHEPASPSLGLLACWASTVPVVATFHAANPRSRAWFAASSILQTALDKITARIAVSEQARRTIVDHLDADAVVIPNGIFTAPFAMARPARRDPGASPTVVFLGRLDEPRKGLDVLLAGVPAIVAACPDVRVLIAGRGDAAGRGDSGGRAGGGRAGGGPGAHPAVQYLGGIDDEQKLRLLGTADVYVGPHTGQESFGIVLIEAMAAGAAVVASDLPAFTDVLDGGRAGLLFPTGDADALAAAVGGLLTDPVRREALAAAGRGVAARYDWSVVGERIEAVYDIVRDRVPTRLSAPAGR